MSIRIVPGTLCSDFQGFRFLTGKGSCINPGSGEGKIERKPANQKLLSSKIRIG